MKWEERRRETFVHVDRVFLLLFFFNVFFVLFLEKILSVGHVIAKVVLTIHINFQKHER